MADKEKSFVEDTINLEEIKDMIGDEALPELTPEKLQENAGPEPEQQAEESSGSGRGLTYELYNMLHDLVYILAVVTLLFVFVIRLVGVDGTSMVPTLHHKDFLLLESNFLYHPDKIENGDIVVLNEPYHWERDRSLIVKRVIATEGQTIDINFDTHEVSVDGVVLQEDYINEPTSFNWDGDYAMTYPAKVPEGHIFVLGDNRNNSSDSRFAPVGMIDARCVLGKALAIAVPGQTRDGQGNIVSPREWNRIGLVS